MIDQIAAKFMALNDSNREAAIDYVTELLRDQTDSDSFRGDVSQNASPLKDSGEGCHWKETKMIPIKIKSGVKLYGPYIYEYAWVNGRRKFVRYCGKAK